MKRIFFVAALLIAFSIPPSFSQKLVMANYTDTLTDAQTKTYAAPVQDQLIYGSFGIYIDHLSGSTDSTYVSIQGSLDGLTWVTLGALPTYANAVTIGSAAPTTFDNYKAYTTDGGMIWNITNPLILPYYQYSVTHYATGTIRVKGWLYKKK